MDINRYNALITIRSVLNEGMKIKDAMVKHLPFDLHDRDRAFVMELVYGTVRYKLFLEWLLSSFLEKRKKLRTTTRLNLLTAFYQLAIMKTADWAAVNEAVEIEKHTKGNPSLVNAVLRNYIRKGQATVISSLPENEISNISITTSHPEWMIKRWMSRFSRDETTALACANNVIPPLTLRVNTLRSGLDEVARYLSSAAIEFDLSQYSPDAIILHNVPFSALRPLKGKIFVQDEASQIISYLLDPHPGQRILDACAAPGGKTTHLAQITGDRAEIVAVDKSRKRMALLRENVDTIGCTSVTRVAADIMHLNDQDSFDRILVDAPCSALGTIRRSPDVKYRHNNDSITSFGKRQTDLLFHTSTLLRKGGILVYSVCTNEPEETSDAVQNFLNIRQDFYIINNILGIALPEPFRKNVASFFNAKKYMFSYPHIHGTDGFFAVRLGKK